MPFLARFLNEFSTGFADNTHFDVQVFVPIGLVEWVVTQHRALEILDLVLPTVGQFLDPTFSASQVTQWLANGLLCRSAKMPDRGFNTTTNQLLGYSEKFPVNTQYSDIDLTFNQAYVAGDNAVPRFFHYWMNYIHDLSNGPESGMNFRFPQDYYGTLRVNCHNRLNHETLAYQFDNAYPIAVDATPMSWLAGGAFNTQQVKFAYSYFKVLPFEAPPLIDVTINL